MTDFTVYDATTHPIVRLEDDWNNLINHGLNKEYDFLVYNNGAYAEALDGATGKIAYGGPLNIGAVSGLNPADVIQACLDNLTAARTWQEKVMVKGNFITDKALIIDDYTIFQNNGKITLDDNVNCDMISTPFPGTNVNQYISLINGTYDGNKVNNATGGYGINFRCWASSIYNVRVFETKDDCYHIGSVVGANGAIENVITQCWAEGSDADGFFVDQTATDCYLHHLWTMRNVNGLYGSAHALQVDHLHTYGNTNGIYHYHGKYCKYHSLYVETNVNHGFYIEGGPHDTVEISNSYFLGNNIAAGAFDDIHAEGALLNWVDGLNIHDNTFQSYAGAQGRYNVYATYPDQLLSIQSNDFIGYTTLPVYIDALPAGGVLKRRFDHQILSGALDLSAAGAVELEVYHATRPGQIVSWTMLVTETTSVHAAVEVHIGRYQDSVALDDDYFDAEPSPTVTTKGVAFLYRTVDLTNTLIATGDTVTVGTDAGKVGDGEVRIILDIVDT